MQIFRGIEATRRFISEEKKLSKSIGLVPTMGALHQGHLSLVAKSVHENDTTIASIFVNPLQFNNQSDLQNYPRPIDQDLLILKEAGCHAVFVPESAEMYKKPISLSLDFGDLDKILEGKFRPGHFNGVGIVVSKLFNIIQPDIAYFGQKDFQQFLIINKIVSDLNFPLQLKCEPIVREPDGLAMSSRNRRLSSDQRKISSTLYQILQETAIGLKENKLEELKRAAVKKSANLDIKLDYLELADRENLRILSQYDDTIPSILLIAAYIGEIRLIDNILV